MCRWGELLLQCRVNTANQCRDKSKIDLFGLQLLNKIPKRVIRKHLESVTHAFKVTKEEEIELSITDRLSGEFVYPLTEITFSLKWYSIHKSKFHDTVKFKTHLQRLETPIKCFNCGGNHLMKDWPKPKKGKERHISTLRPDCAYNL